VVVVLTRTHLPVRLMGLVVVFLGLWTVKDAVLPGWGWHLAMPVRFHGAVRAALAKTGPAGLFVAGGLVGLCTVPCSGAIYLGVLGLLAREPLPRRLALLLAYNLAFIAPLLGLLASVTNRRSLNRIAHWYVPRRAAAGMALGAVAIVLGFVILITV
jgi:cytochrome c-type biogenesis protein